MGTASTLAPPAAGQLRLRHLRASSLHLAAAAPSTSAFLGAEALRLTRLSEGVTNDKASASRQDRDAGAEAVLRARSGVGGSHGRVNTCNACGACLLPGWNARRKIVRNVRSNDANEQHETDAAGPMKEKRPSKRRKVEWDERKRAKLSSLESAAATSSADAMIGVEARSNVSTRTSSPAKDQSQSSNTHERAHVQRALTAIVLKCGRCGRSTQTALSRTHTQPESAKQQAARAEAAAPVSPIMKAGTEARQDHGGDRAAISEGDGHKRAGVSTASKARARAKKKGGLAARAKKEDVWRKEREKGSALELGLMDFMKGTEG